jgi:hypothetical protein
MKNVYDGVVVLDDKGEAEISLPDCMDYTQEALLTVL